jgi:hypothetical protein
MEAIGNERGRGVPIFLFGCVFQGPPMNYSQMKDERLFAFYENVRQQSQWIKDAVTVCWRRRSRLRGETSRRNGEAAVEVHAD